MSSEAQNQAHERLAEIASLRGRAWSTLVDPDSDATDRARAVAEAVEWRAAVPGGGPDTGAPASAPLDPGVSEIVAELRDLAESEAEAWGLDPDRARNLRAEQQALMCGRLREALGTARSGAAVQVATLAEIETAGWRSVGGN